MKILHMFIQVFNIKIKISINFNNNLINVNLYIENKNYKFERL